MLTDWPSDGKLDRVGEIEGEVDIDELLREDKNYPVCSIGELPNWIAPWKTCQADGVRPASQSWTFREVG